MGLQNTTAIITGGTGALGSIVASRFFDAGVNVAIPFFSRQPGLLPDRVVNSNDRSLLVHADLSIESDVTTFVKAVVEKYSQIDFLANIAGGYAGGQIAETSLEKWDSMMTMNLKSTFLMSREVLKHMLHRTKGRIVNVSSMPALTSGANKAAYAISKRGVVALTETLADETKGTGITVNAIAPSIVLTDDNKLSMPSADFGKWVTTEEIADVILFLCSDAARSISGNTIRIFGGV